MVMYAIWDKIDKNESEKDFEEEKFLSYFYESFLWGTKSNSNLDSSIDQLCLPSYDELSHAFNELQNEPFFV